MKTFTISLPAADLDRLFAIQQMQGRDDITSGDFAGYILSKELRRIFPGLPELDETGAVSNPEQYSGPCKRRAAAEYMAYRVAESPEELEAIADGIETDLDPDGNRIIPNGPRATAELIASVVRETLRPVGGEAAR